MMKRISLLLAITSIGASNLIAQDVLFEYPSRAEIEIELKCTVIQNNEHYIYNFTVASLPESKLNIEELYVEYFTEITDITNPSNWISLLSNVKTPIIIWGSEDELYDIEPNEELSGFSFQSLGVPGLVNFYAAGHVEEPEFDAGQAPPMESINGLDIFENSYQGKTIGPKAISETATNNDLADTLSSYLSLSCNLGWIENPGVCRSLEASLDNVKRQLDQGRTQTAAGNLQAFLNEVEALRERQLSPEAYALLKFNGEFLLQKLREE